RARTDACPHHGLSPRDLGRGDVLGRRHSGRSSAPGPRARTDRARARLAAVRDASRAVRCVPGAGGAVDVVLGGCLVGVDYEGVEGGWTLDVGRWTRPR